MKDGRTWTTMVLTCDVVPYANTVFFVVDAVLAILTHNVIPTVVVGNPLKLAAKGHTNQDGRYVNV